jgi:IS1 family transposase
MRKLLPYILGIAALLWIVGGTMWYSNRYCDVVLQPVVNATASQVSLHNTYPMPEQTFQALTLYYPKKKYQFKMTDELSFYFNDLKGFLSRHTTAKIHIVSQNTEGYNTGQKRLSYIKNTLKAKDFNLNQFEFYNTEFQQKAVNFQEEDVKNQRIEIRLTVP